MLFDNNEFVNFIDKIPGNYDLDSNLFDPNNKTYSNQQRFYSTKEGFLRGNMFRDLYEPYKNLTYKEIIPRTEREALKLKIDEFDFAMNDLNLYLDTNPRDTEVFNMFKKFADEYKSAIKEYSKKFGPLLIYQDDGNMYDWLKSPWPWNDGGDKYV